MKFIYFSDDLHDFKLFFSFTDARVVFETFFDLFGWCCCFYECTKRLRVVGFRRKCDRPLVSWTFFRLLFAIGAMLLIVFCLDVDGCIIPGNLLRSANAIVIIRFSEISSDANKLPPKMFIDHNLIHVVAKMCSQTVLP